MYILDTDHLSVLDRGGAEAQRLVQRLTGVDSTQIAASIISYEEQMRGWLSYLAVLISDKLWVYALRIGHESDR